MKGGETRKLIETPRKGDIAICKTHSGVTEKGNSCNCPRKRGLIGNTIKSGLTGKNTEHGIMGRKKFSNPKKGRNKVSAPLVISIEKKKNQNLSQ